MNSTKHEKRSDLFLRGNNQEYLEKSSINIASNLHPLIEIIGDVQTSLWINSKGKLETLADLRNGSYLLFYSWQGKLIVESGSLWGHWKLLVSKHTM